MRRMRLIACLAASVAFFAVPALAHEDDNADDCGCHHHQGLVLNGTLNTADFDGGVGYGVAGDGYASGYSFSYGGASAFAGSSAAAFALASASAHVSISTHFGGFHGGIGHGGGMGHGGFGGHGGHGGMGGWGGGHH